VIKVLQVLAFEPVGGVGTFLENMSENLDKNEIKFDFLLSPSHRKSDFGKKMTDEGNTLYWLPSLTLKHAFEYIRKTKDFYKNNANKYDIVHIHAPNIAIIHLFYAKKYGLKVRILHSHNTQYANTGIKAVRNFILVRPAIKLATNLFAASRASGDFLFGNRKYYIINNGVDMNKYGFNSEIRTRVRNKLGMSDQKFVIGHVGNFIPVKNQKFIINLASKMDSKYFEFLLIGAGTLEEPLKKLCKEKNIQNVHFLGKRNDVDFLYQAMDVFILPSLYEGLPFVAVEAQASGLPIILSDAVTRETAFTKKSIFLPVGHQYLSNWKKQLLVIKESNNRTAINHDIVKTTPFNIKNSAKVLLNNYRLALRG